MTSNELARAAAHHIARMLTGREADAWLAQDSFVDIAAPIIAGAITRALEDAHADLVYALEVARCDLLHYRRAYMVAAGVPEGEAALAAIDAALARATGEGPTC